MIQAVSSVSATPIRKHSASFGQDNPQDKGPLLGPAGRCDVDIEERLHRREKAAKRKAIAGYIGGQFVAGAVVSAVFDGVVNLFNVIRKRPEKLTSLPVAGANALMMGVAFAIIGGIFAAIDVAKSRKQ